MNLRRGTFLFAYAIFYCGLFFHKSNKPVVGNFGTAYLIFLLVMLLGFAAPFLWAAIRRRFDRKELSRTAGITVAALLVIHYIASGVYYQQRVVPFDPFLQTAPTSIGGVGNSPQPGEVVIVSIGGSTTENSHMPLADRYPAHLETLLRQRAPEAGVRVINAGKSWWTTKHSLINYVTNIRDTKPRIAIVMHAINDLYRSCSPYRLAGGDYQSDWSHYYGAASWAANPPTFTRILYETSLGALFSKWFSIFRTREIDYDISFYRSLPDYEKSMRRLIEVLSNDGVTPVLMTQPSLYKAVTPIAEWNKIVFAKQFCTSREEWFYTSYPSVNSMRMAMSAYNDVARRLAEKYRINLIDAERHIPKDLDHFMDDVHYTIKGSRMVADLVATKLISIGDLLSSKERAK